MIVEFLAAIECMPQRGQEFVRPLKNFGNRIDKSLVVTRLMPRNRRSYRRHDVHGAALLGKENLNARARGFCRLDKDKLVFVRNDHRPVPRTLETQRNLSDDW